MCARANDIVDRPGEHLANFMRTSALPRAVSQWSLMTLHDKLIKIGAKVAHHARYVTFQLAEVAVPRELFSAILERTLRAGVGVGENGEELELVARRQTRSGSTSS